MIVVYFNRNGYYIIGQEIECCRKMSPALDNEGSQIFSESLHLYKVLQTALEEDSLFGLKKREEIIVYGDSRIIDELNGGVPPLIDEHSEFKRHLKRNLIPLISGIVFFRKCSTSLLNSMVEKGHDKMLNKLSPERRLKLVNEQVESQKKLIESRKQRILNKFKERLNG